MYIYLFSKKKSNQRTSLRMIRLLLKGIFGEISGFNKESLIRLFRILCFFSGAANNHVTAFFQDRPIFCFSDNLGYSLLKNTRYPNLWPPYRGIWSNSIILSFVDKYRS